MMVNRSDEAEWWFNAVYAAVQEIPRGRVTSYGHIAMLLGKRRATYSYLFRICFVETVAKDLKAERPRSVRRSK